MEAIARQQPPARKALREIARHPRASAPALLACLQDPRARALAAGRPALPVPAIVSLLASQDGRTAEAAAANPSLPAETMTGLIP